MKLYEIPEGKIIFRHDLIEQHTVIVGEEKFVFTNMPEAKLLYEAAQFFGEGSYLLPDNEEDAQVALTDWLAHKKQLEAWFQKRADEKTDDERFKQRMVAAFWELYRKYRRGTGKPPASPRSPVHKISVALSTEEEGSPIEFRPIPSAIPQPVPSVAAPAEAMPSASQEQPAFSS